MAVLFAAALYMIWIVKPASIYFLTPSGYSYESRERIFRLAIESIKSKPVFGWGLTNVDYATEAFDWPVTVYNDVHIDKAHSNLLEIFVTTGITGGIIYLLILKKVWNNLSEKTLKTVFVLYLIHSQTNVISIAEEVIFWLIVGVAISQKAKPRQLHSRTY
jgi:O-antigen ligase